MGEIFDLQEMIKKSINREKLSAELYRGWIGRFADEATNETLRMLTRDEESHVKLLELCLADGKLDRIGKREPGQKLRNPPKVPEVHTFDENSTAKEIIAFAIHHEDRAIHYYARYADIFRDTPLFEFFSRMTREEEGHKERLESIFLREFAGRRG